MNSREEGLQTLHAILADTRHGYEEALKREPDSELAPLLRHMSALHLAAGDEVAQLLEGLGVQANEEGSFMSTVQRTVTDVRSMITGIGENMLPSLVSGEERNLAHYDTVLDAVGMLDGLEAPLRAQRKRLAIAIADMRHINNMA
jgi:uncharacterized protein (TIGR02284 family)